MLASKWNIVVALIFGGCCGTTIGLAFATLHLDPAPIQLRDWFALVGAALGVLGAFGVAAFQVSIVKRQQRTAVRIQLIQDLSDLYRSVEMPFMALGKCRNDVLLRARSEQTLEILRTANRPREGIYHRMTHAAGVLPIEASEAIEGLVSDLQVFWARYSGLTDDDRDEMRSWNVGYFRSNLRLLVRMRRRIDALLEWSRGDADDPRVTDEWPSVEEARRFAVVSGATGIWTIEALNSIFELQNE